MYYIYEKEEGYSLEKFTNQVFKTADEAINWLFEDIKKDAEHNDFEEEWENGDVKVSNSTLKKLLVNAFGKPMF